MTFLKTGLYIVSVFGKKLFYTNNGEIVDCSDLVSNFKNFRELIDDDWETIRLVIEKSYGAIFIKTNSDKLLEDRPFLPIYKVFSDEKINTESTEMQTNDSLEIETIRHEAGKRFDSIEKEMDSLKFYLQDKIDRLLKKSHEKQTL